MSHLRSVPGLVKTALAALLLVAVAAACDEDGRSLPENCAEDLPLDDIANAGVPAVTNPCLTRIGHAVSGVAGSGTPSTGGTSTAGSQNAQGGADAGAGGS